MAGSDGDPGGLDGGREVLLRFALSKEYEDIGEHARAFDQVTAACVLQRRSIDYDIGAEIAEIDQIIRTQTRSWLAACPPTAMAESCMA